MERAMHTHTTPVKEVEQINHLPLPQSYFKGIQSTPLTNSTIGE